MDFNLDTLLNLPNVTVFSYSTELEFIILNLLLINEVKLATIVTDLDKSSLLEVIDSHKRSNKN